MMKVALLGYGYWGKIVEKYINLSKDIELKKIYVRKSVGQNNIFTSNLSDIMFDNEIKAVFICLPASLHFEMCKISLENGKHIFCEKPLVKYEQDHYELEKLAIECKKVLYVDYIYNVSPSIRTIKENLHLIGDIHLVEGQIFQFGKFYNEDSIWENIGIHLISVLCDWFQNVKIKDIKRFVNANGNIESVLLKEEHGIQFKLECSLICPQKKRGIYIYGKNGSICFDMLDSDATVRMNLFNNTENGISLIDTKCWKFDEMNNLEFSINRFHDLVKHRDYNSNLYLSNQIDVLLQDILNSQPIEN